MSTLTVSTLTKRNDDELDFMIFGFGYFLVRILTEQGNRVDSTLIAQINTIIGNINAATSSEAILDATVRREGSLWQRIYIGPRGELQIADSADQATAGYQPFFVNNFEANGVTLRDKNILAHVMHCLCYGIMSLDPKFRFKSLYNRFARDSDQKIARLVSAWCCTNEDVVENLVTVPVSENIIDTVINLKQIVTNSPKLEGTRYLSVLNEFITVEQRRQIEQLTLSKGKKTFFIFAFAGLIILSLAIIAAANVISWANLIKIALLSSIAAKAGIAAVGIVIGGILLFLANMLRCRKDIFVCPCDESCRKHCVREENSQKELLAHSKGIAQ
jgi:hypothetical protein